MPPSYWQRLTVPCEIPDVTSFLLGNDHAEGLAVGKNCDTTTPPVSMISATRSVFSAGASRADLPSTLELVAPSDQALAAT